MSANHVSWSLGRFAAVLCPSVSSIPAARLLFEKDAALQIKLEARSPFITILGTACKGPPELTDNKICWLAMFDNRDAYHDGEHVERANKDLMPELSSLLLTGNITDYAGGFRGACMHLEKSTGGVNSGHAIYVTAKAKDAAKATELLEALKAHGLRQMEAEPGALRFTVFMPGGDLPPQFTDDVTVRFVETWAKAADYDAHKQTSHVAEFSKKLEELTESVQLVEYDNVVHVTK